MAASPAVDAGSSARLAQRYLRHLAVELGRSPHTVSGYRRDLDGYLAHLGARAIGEVTRADVEAYVGGLRSRTPPQSPASVARALSAVRGLHRFALEEGLVTVDPTADVSPPKAAQRLPKALAIDEIARLIAATEGESPERLRDRALLEFLYATGARVSEAVDLDVDDVAEVTDVIRLTGKGRKTRIVPLGSYARAAIEAYLVRARPVLAAGGGRGGPALFLGSRGGRLSRQHVWLIIRAAGERAGISAEHLSPHTMRHSFATHLLQGGADVRVVQELLGHASVATTQIYTKVTADALREVYAQAHPRARRP